MPSSFFVVIALIFSAAAADAQPFFRMLENEFAGPFRPSVVSWYPQEPREDGAVILNGGYIYGVGPHGISVYEQSAQTNLVFLGQFNRPDYKGPFPDGLSSRTRGPQMSGETLYWGVHKNLEIFDASMPLEIRPVAVITNIFPHGNESFFVQNNDLFIVSDDLLSIFELERGVHPRLLSATEVSGGILAAVQGSRVLLGSVRLMDTNALEVMNLIDIADLSSPRMIWSYERNADSSFGVTLFDKLVVKCESNNQRLVVFDPERNPTASVNYNLSAVPVGIFTSGTNLYIQTVSGTFIYYKTPESKLIRSGTIPAGLGAGPTTANGNQFCQIEFGPDQTALSVYDVSNPARPVRVARHMGRDRILPYTDMIEATGDQVQLATGQVIDVRNTNAFRTYSFPSGSTPMATFGNAGYRFDGTRLRVINVSDPAKRPTVKTIDLKTPIVDIFVAGAELFAGTVAPGETALTAYVYSLADPLEPSLVFTKYYPDPVNVFVVEPYIYEFTAGLLRITDMSNPTNWVEKGSLLFPAGDVYDVRPIANYLYVPMIRSDGKIVTAIVDASDLENPVLVNFLEAGGDLAAFGDYLYVSSLSLSSDDPLTLKVFSKRDPANPAPVTELPVFGRVSLDLGYLIAGDSVNDISNASAPEVVDTLPLSQGYRLEGDQILNWQRDQVIIYRLDRLSHRADDFENGGGEQWRWSNGSGSAGVFAVENGGLNIKGGSSGGFLLPETALYSDVQVKADVPEEGGVTVASRLSETAAGEFECYEAEFSAGTGTLILRKRIGETTETLASAAGIRLDALEFSVSGNRLLARAFEKGTVTGALAASDTELSSGFVAVQVAPNENLELESFEISGVKALPELRASIESRVSWSDTGEDYILELTHSLSDAWQPVSGVQRSSSQLLDWIERDSSSPISFYRLRKKL